MSSPSRELLAKTIIQLEKRVNQGDTELEEGNLSLLAASLFLDTPEIAGPLIAEGNALAEEAKADLSFYNYGLPASLVEDFLDEELEEIFSKNDLG